MTPAPLRVRHIPAAHAYVEHLLPVEGSARVVHLPDPPVPGAPPGQWWPHPALEPGWVREHGGEQDVVHLHFGTEGRTTEELDAWLAALREVGLPLVHTVHDIDHPQVRDQTRHREHLALLVEAADGLLTLTEGAADAVERSFGRRPLVVPHPHVAPLARVGSRGEVGRTKGAASGPLRVGLHLKGLRTNLAPMRVLPPLVEAVGRLRAEGVPVELEVRAHPEVLEEGGARHDPELAAWWADVEGAQGARAQGARAAAGVSVVAGPRMDDDELWDYLAGLDVSVLAYAWGTHSGWVEACRDLGTWVLAPGVGHLAEQGAGAVLAWGDPDVAPEVDVLVDLLRRAAEDRPPRVTAEERATQRDRLAALHTRVYELVVAGERVDASTAAGWRPTADGERMAL